MRVCELAALSVPEGMDAYDAEEVRSFAASMPLSALVHAQGVFPPEGEPMFDPWLNALALGYRSVFSVAGCAITAALAPRAPMAHALTLGGIGTVLASLGAYMAMGLNLGPMWYPVALAASALPCVWLGGMLVRR